MPAATERFVLLAVLLLATAGARAGAAGDRADGGDDAGAVALAQADALPGLSYFHDFGDVGGGLRRELAGLTVNGREHPEGIEILREADGVVRLPLRALAERLQLAVGEETDALRLETPLGAARFRRGELRLGAQEAFAPLALIAERLASKIEFDESAYAVIIDVVWPTTTDAGASPQQPIRPDVEAPGADLSRLRGALWHHHDELQTRTDARIEAGGRLGPGSWQVRYLDDDSGPGRWQDYYWRVRSGQWAGQLGHQLVGTHPLLPAFDLTGAQAAWTNAPERLYAPLDPDRLVADRPGAVRTLRGDGPPGGVAELRIDGRSLARQRIPLDGVFEFIGVPVPTGYAQIEILLYESDVSAAPTARLDYSDRASDRMLGAGEYLVHGGVGRDGNPLDELRPDRGNAGFLRGRAAIGARATVEATLQSSGFGEQGLLGADVALGRLGIGSAAYAHGDGGDAWLAGLDGGGERWFWRGYVQEQDAGFRGEDSARLSERSGEVGWRRWPYAELSLVGRQRREHGQPEIDFVKPAARLRPLRGLFLQARPDFNGDYMYDLEWLPRHDLRAALHHDSRLAQAQLDYRFATDWLASAAVTRDRSIERTRESLIVSYQEPEFYGWIVEAGVLHSSGDIGFLARVGRELLPGIQFRFEARRDPLYEHDLEQRGTVASLGLLFDLGRAGGRFTRASGVRADTGALAGAIVVTGTALSPPEGVTVRIDGQPRTRTDAAGRFHVGGLAPGVYRVELDEEGLPIELSIDSDGYWAEVASGAATSVDFRVELRLGVAGRVRVAADVPLDRLAVAVLDAAGRRLRAIAPNAFGYYRVDGLAPGRYRLVLERDGVELARREVVLDADFLFGQDLTFDAPPPAARSGQ